MCAINAVRRPEPHGFRITIGPDPTPSERAYVELSVDAAGLYLRAPRIIRDKKDRTATTRDRQRARAVVGGRWPILDAAIAQMPDMRATSKRQATKAATWVRAAAFLHLVDADMPQRAAARMVLVWDVQFGAPHANVRLADLARRPRDSLDAVEVQELRDAESAVIQSARRVKKRLASLPTRP
jgi:hypothetical protein